MPDGPGPAGHPWPERPGRDQGNEQGQHGQRAWPPGGGGWRPRAWRGPTPRYQGQLQSDWPDEPDEPGPHPFPADPFASAGGPDLRPGQQFQPEQWTPGDQIPPGEPAGSPHPVPLGPLPSLSGLRRRPGRSWPARHKALTGLLAVLAVLGLLAGARAAVSPPPYRVVAGAGLTTPVSPSATAAQGSRPDATPSPAHPRQVRGAGAASPATWAPGTATAPAAPAATKTVPAGASASRSPAPASAPPTTAATRPTAATSPTSATSPAAAASPTAVATPTPSATTVSCYPLTAGGKCFKVGGSCPKADHGVFGVAAGGETIKCKDDGGWLWVAV